MLVFYSPVFAESPQLPGFSLDDIDRQDNEILNLDLSQVDVNSPAAFEDVPKDHWAYKAVQRLASLGLLNGYNGGEFRGDQVVTRYELAVIVAKMLDNYNKYLQNGYIENNVPVERNWPDASEFPQPQITYTAEPVPEAKTLPQTVQMKRIQEPPPGPVAPAQPPAVAPTYIPTAPVPSVQPSSRPYSQDELQLKSGPGVNGSQYGNTQPIIRTGPSPARHTGPKMIGDTTTNQPAPDTTKPAADTSKDKSKDTSKDTSKDKGKSKDTSKDTSKDKSKDTSKDKASGKDAANGADAGSAKAKKVPKELKKASEKFEITEKDVELFDALVKYVKDELKTMKKDIEKEIGEVKRSTKKNEGDIEKLQLEDQRFRVTGNAGFYIHSSHVTQGARDSVTTSGDSGDTRTDVSDGNNTVGFSVYSKPRKYDDLQLTTDLTGNGGNTHIKFADYSQDKDHPRNFKLRTLDLGPTSLGFSPLTIFGSGYTGVNSNLLLNKFNINMGIGRVDAINYLYGVSAQTNFLHNTASLLHISRFFSFQDKDFQNDNYDNNMHRGCHRADVNWQDIFYPIGSWTSGSSICLPPEKNSVTSVFLDTATKFPWLNFMGEYAHSTYYRPGFNMTMSANNGDPHNIANTYAPSDEYTTWRPIPERRDSDEAFLALFTYNKGPVNIFPFGYARLGKNFVTKYMGLPGFDASTLNLSVLPIKIQSIQLFVVRPTITKTEDRWRADMTYVIGGEHAPMFLDPSGMASQAGIVNGFSILDRLNNRKDDGMLRLAYMNGSVTYYVSDKITMSAGFGRTRVALGPTCIDANIVSVQDDFGNVVDKVLGNGYTNCNHADPKFENDDINALIRYNQDSKNFSMYWRTSQKASYSMGYSWSKSLPLIDVGNQAINDALLALIPNNQSYSFNQNISYRLTDVSSVQFWFNTNFYRPEDLISKQADPVKYLHNHPNSNDVGFRLDMSF